jgi:hypothetical protein
MKRSVFVVVALLAAASLMAAMAYSTATVRSAGEILIANSNSALVSIGHAGTDQDKIVQNEDGKAVFYFGRGFEGGMFGFQQDSEYHYDYFMHVINNSDNPVEVWLELEGFGDAAAWITISHGGTVLIDEGSQTGDRVTIDLDGWRTRNFTLDINVEGGAVMDSFSGTVIVHAERAD